MDQTPNLQLVSETKLPDSLINFANDLHCKVYQHQKMLCFYHHKYFFKSLITSLILKVKLQDIFWDFLNSEDYIKNYFASTGILKIDIIYILCQSYKNKKSCF